MKNNFMHLLSILLIGVMSIEAQQQSSPHIAQSRLALAYQILRNNIMAQLSETDNPEDALAFQTNADAIATILSSDPQVSYETKRTAFFALMGLNLDPTFLKTIDGTAFEKNKVVINFLYDCSALDTLKQSDGLSTMQDFFENFSKDERIPQPTQRSISVSLKTAISRVTQQEIDYPFSRALAASQIIGQLSGKKANNLEFDNALVIIEGSLYDSNLFEQSPEIWTTLAQQTLNSVINANPEQTTLSNDVISLRTNEIKKIGRMFTQSIPRKSAARRLSGWFREYFSISKLVLRARSASMSDAQRYKTAMDLTQSLQANSKVNSRDICRSIGIVLRSLSGKEQIDGQPEKLLQKLATNVTAAMVTEEIISRVSPAITVTRRNRPISLRTLFMEGLSNLEKTPATSLGEVFETHNTFNPATVAEKPAEIPAKTSPTSTKTNTAEQGSESTTDTTKLTDAEQRRRAVEQERLAEEQEIRDAARRLKRKQPIQEEEPEEEEGR